MIRTLLDGLPDLAMLFCRDDGRIIEVGSYGLRRLGYDASGVQGELVHHFAHPEDAVRIESAKAALENGDEDRFEIRLRAASGEWRNYLVSVRMFSDDNVILLGQDTEVLTSSHSTLADLTRLASLTDDIFVVSDSNGIVTYANDAAGRLHGEQEFVGRPISQFGSGPGWGEIVKRAIAGETSIRARVLGITPGGGTAPLEVRTYYDSETDRWYTVERNITQHVAAEQQMQELHEELRRQATTDALTGVANRMAFTTTAEHAIESNTPFSVLLLDMDQFKSVNDTYGHGVGDDLLKIVAERLRNAVADTDTVARLGGDEFVIFLPDLNRDQAALVAERIVNVISQPLELWGKILSTACSVGVATRQPGDSLSDVLRRADRAAYRAKDAGRNGFVLDDTATT